jgi:ribosome-associated translation inhibitor RaiA
LGVEALGYGLPAPEAVEPKRALEVDSALDAYVKRRIHFALGRFSSRVERVSVVLSHENGPDGGMGKTCCFRVRLLGLPTVAIKEADFDVRAAIDRAADRIGRTVAIRLSPVVDSLQGKGKPTGLRKEQP